MLDETQPDLIVLGQVAARHARPCELRVSADGSGPVLDVTLPLHAFDLEAALNKTGDAILARRAALHTQLGGLEGDALLQLTRWPSAQVLANHAPNFRLATLLTARPRTLAQLTELSGISLAGCHRFCEAALAAGVLETRAAPTPVLAIEPDTRTRARDLLDLIRARLGLKGPRG